MVEHNPINEVPSWATADPNVAAADMDPTGPRGGKRNLLAGAALVGAIFATGGGVLAYNQLAGNHADDPVDIGDMTVDQITDTTFKDACDAPAYEGTDRQAVLGNNAFFSYDLASKDEDILKTMRNTLSRNLVGIAAADTIIKSYSNEVDFTSLNKEVDDKLKAISDSDEVRAKACEDVLAAFAVNAQRVTVSGGTFVEIVPVYNTDGTSNTSKVDFVQVDAKTLFDEKGGVEGIWTDVKYGQAAVVMTPGGRLFIVKNIGKENGAANTDNTSDVTAPVQTTIAEGETVTGTTISNTNIGTGADKTGTTVAGQKPTQTSTADAPGNTKDTLGTPTDIPGTVPGTTTKTTSPNTVVVTTSPSTLPPITVVVTTTPNTQPPATNPPTTVEQRYSFDACDLYQPRNEGGFGVLVHFANLTAAQRDALLANPQYKTNYTNLGDSNGDGQVICK